MDKAGPDVKKRNTPIQTNVIKLPPPIYDAFTCPKDTFPERNKDGTIKHCTANAIAALRHLLDDKKIEVKFDNWRQHYIIIAPLVNDPIRQWRNEIYQKYTLSISEAMLKDAKIQLSVKHQFHSQIQYYRTLQWDNVSRIEAFVKNCLHMEGTKLELCVIGMQLIASVRRVYLPGTAYDLVPCLLSPQGYMKSKMLSILYGEHNVLAEDISCYDTRKQSEKTRHGINCVELPGCARRPKYQTVN